MEILILGPGCKKCVLTYEVIKKVVDQSGIDITIRKVEDIMEIMKYNVMSTPAVVVDGEVKVKGHVPTESEVKKVINGTHKSM